MQQQIEGFISNLNQELSKRAATTKPKEEDLSLMPVIQITSLSRSAEGKKPVIETKRKGWRG
jgi:hypothetical protein